MLSEAQLSSEVGSVVIVSNNISDFGCDRHLRINIHFVWYSILKHYYHTMRKICQTWKDFCLLLRYIVNSLSYNIVVVSLFDALISETAGWGENVAGIMWAVVRDLSQYRGQGAVGSQEHVMACYVNIQWAKGGTSQRGRVCRSRSHHIEVQVYFYSVYISIPYIFLFRVCNFGYNLKSLGRLASFKIRQAISSPAKHSKRSISDIRASCEVSRYSGTSLYKMPYFCTCRYWRLARHYCWPRDYKRKLLTSSYYMQTPFGTSCACMPPSISVLYDTAKWLMARITDHIYWRYSTEY